ncbi:MAG TPA: efflux RND transporter periplasmic adaptor subunit [Prolixibacteraceae bacterium]
MKTKVFQIVSLSLIIIIIFSCTNSDKKEMIEHQFMGYVENTQVNITGRLPGKITAIYVDEGDTVKQGEKIAQLDARELDANMAALNFQLKNIILNKSRIEHLFQAGALPQQKVDEIETSYEVLRSNILALKTKIEDMVITSPIDGIVNVKVLECGQMLSPGMAVVIVTDPDGTWARFSIPEKYMNLIKLGQQFEITSNTPGISYAAKVIQTLPFAEFATHTPTTLRDERDIRTFDVKMKLIDTPQHASVITCKPGMYVYLTLKDSIIENSKLNKNQ